MVVLISQIAAREREASNSTRSVAGRASDMQISAVIVRVAALLLNMQQGKEAHVLCQLLA